MKSFNTVAIIGVGLIGGSVGLAVRNRKIARNIVGAGSRMATLQAAQQLGAITAIGDDVETAVAEADLVVVCAPVDHIVEQVRRLAPHCRSGTLITDAGSTKANIVAELDQAARESSWPKAVHFVGSHPLAGNEKKGPQHARADLFDGRTVVVTPTDLTRPQDVAAIADFWQGLGAKVLQMPAEEHDRALAATSHLPHLVAAAIAGATREEYVTLTAGGWLDSTRIAGGDPLLWRQIMLANRENLLAALDRFTGLLGDWRKALASSDADGLENLLKEAKRIRDAVGN